MSLFRHPDRVPSRPRSVRLLACALVLLPASVAVADAPPVTVEGQIFDREGRPISGVEITVLEKTPDAFAINEAYREGVVKIIIDVSES